MRGFPLSERRLRTILLVAIGAFILSVIWAGAGPALARPQARAAAYRVSGRVLGLGPAFRLSLQCPSHGCQLPTNIYLFPGFDCGPRPNVRADYTSALASDGTWEVRNVPPGKYAACTEGGGPLMWVGPVPVVVADKDVTLDIDVLTVPRSRADFSGPQRNLIGSGFASLTGIPPGATVSGQVLSAVPQAASATRRPIGGVEPVGTAIADLYLIADSGEFAGRRVVGWTSSMGSPTNGRFEIRNVPPGAYVLFASLPDLSGYSSSAPPGQAVNPVAFGRTSIVVGKSDVQPVTVRVHQGVDVQGRITIDGAPPAHGTVEIALRSDDSAFGIPVYQQVGRFRPAIVENTFTIPAVPEGRYRLTVTLAAKPDAFVADILQAGVSIRETGLTVRETPPAPVEVVVRTGNSGTDPN